MATIVRRIGKDGQRSYRAHIRRKGAPLLSATFSKLSEARKWAQTSHVVVPASVIVTICAKHRLDGIGDVRRGRQRPHSRVSDRIQVPEN